MTTTMFKISESMWVAPELVTFVEVYHEPGTPEFDCVILGMAGPRIYTLPFSDDKLSETPGLMRLGYKSADDFAEALLIAIHEAKKK